MKKLKLFCFPHAGASATIYNQWKCYTDNKIDIVPVEYAGRGERMQEPLYDTFTDLLSDIYVKLKDNIDNNYYALFGHSLGGLLAYELYLKLAKSGIPKPLDVFISGHLPPHVSTTEKILHNLPDEEFKFEVMQLGGTTDAIINANELWEYYEPILRADLKIAEEYSHNVKKEKIDSNLTILYGKNDKKLNDQINEWRDYANNKYGSYVFDGDHFYINNSGQKIIDIIIGTINNTLINLFNEKEHMRS